MEAYEQIGALVLKFPSPYFPLIFFVNGDFSPFLEKEEKMLRTFLSLILTADSREWYGRFIFRSSIIVYIVCNQIFLLGYVSQFAF